LSKAQLKHSQSQNHVHCYLQLKSYGKQQLVVLLLDSQCRNDVTWRNEQVKKNRVLLRVLCAVCYLANQELPLHEIDYSLTLLNKGNTLEFLNNLKMYDQILEYLMDSTTVI